MPLHVFTVLFKTYLFFKDFTRKPSKFKYFSSMCEPCLWIVYTFFLISHQYGGAMSSLFIVWMKNSMVLGHLASLDAN